MAATQRLAALITAGSIALSSTPAFAMNLNLGTNADAKIHGRMYAPFTSIGTDASVNANANANAAVKPGRFMSALRHEFKAELREERKDAKKDVAITQEMIVKLQTRVEGSIRHMINMFAGFAKRACSGKADESATTACMAEIRTSLSTHVQAMINTAFGI
ncbi:MAG TPA: hypothetical protein VJB82_02950 [Candidatus Peribacterales bacterium]|nr:hypothetical protein [Candidatus Peribacterales bacterium]